MASWNRNKTEYAPGIFLDREEAGCVRYVGRAESFIDSGIVRPEWMPGATGCGLTAQAVMFHDGGTSQLLPPRSVSALKNSAHGGIHIKRRGGGCYYVTKYLPANEVKRREADAQRAVEQGAREATKEARGPQLKLVQGGSVSILGINDAQATAQALRRLLGMAEHGEIVGISWAFVTRDRGITCGVAGLMERNRPLAHFGASRLSDSILWDEGDLL